MHLLVVNYEFPPLGGGAANATWYCCRAWSERGHDVTLLTTWFPGLAHTETLWNRVKVHRVPSRRKRQSSSNPLEMISFAVRGMRAVRALATDRRFDCTIAFFGIPSGLIARRLYREFSVPYRILLRGGDVPGFLGRRLALLHLMARPWLLGVWRDAHVLIANSSGLTSLAQKMAGKLGKTVRCVPNGVDTILFHPGKPRKKGNVHFLFIGRFAVQKNLPMLLHAFGLLIQTTNRARAHLTLMGDGPERSTIIRCLSRNPELSPRVTLLPWQSKEKCAETLRGADWFVNPSRDEGMPNTVLEAMASGLPVIASDITGNSELVQNGVTGLLFPVGKPDALLVCFQEAMLQTDRHAMGRRAREAVETSYQWDRVAEEVLV